MRTTVISMISVFVVGSSIISAAQHTVTSADPRSPVKKNVTTVQDTRPPASDSISQNQKLKQKGEKGMIYIGNDWPTGTIVLHDGGVIDGYHLRYNILCDQLEFIKGMDTSTFANPQDLNTVTFDGHTFVFENYQYDSTIREGYFELIVPGKNKLMLKRSVTGQQPDTKTSTKYKVDECYFISKPGMPANKLACNRKSVLAFLTDHDEDIAEYLRITGNKVRTIEDLKLLVSYYNSLDEEY